MAHDPVRAADARAWLAKARGDLGMGRVALAAEPPYPEDAMFHAQQATEKAIKGFLTWHEIPFRKTHDLRELFEACGQSGLSLGTLQDRAEGLTPYAWVFRYPGEEAEPTPEEAEEALALAREVYEAVLARLPAEVRP